MGASISQDFTKDRGWAGEAYITLLVWIGLMRVLPGVVWELWNQRITESFRLKNTFKIIKFNH